MVGLNKSPELTMFSGVLNYDKRKIIIVKKHTSKLSNYKKFIGKRLRLVKQSESYLIGGIKNRKGKVKFFVIKRDDAEIKTIRST